MGSSPPATASPLPGSDPVSPKSAWSSPLPEASGSRAKPVVNLVDGVARVSVPTEIVEESLPLWKCFVVGYFMGDAPHLGTIHATVNRIWNSVGKATRIDVQFLSPKTVLFRIDSDHTRARVLKRKYWHIADVPLVLNEWSPETVHEKPSLSAMPLWVDFRDVPGFLFSQNGLRFLADITGDFVRLHPNTERCTRLDMARILVEVNLEKALTEKICVEDKNGSEFEISVTYPWLPPRCNHCLSWGHKEVDCSKKIATVGDSSSKASVLNVVTSVAGAVNSPDPIAVVAALVTDLENVAVTVGEERQLGAVDLTVTNESSVVSGKVVNAGPEVQAVLGDPNVAAKTTEAMQEAEKGWSVVPLTRKSNSPTKHVDRTGTAVVSPSSFRVLEDTPEDGEIVETEKEQTEQPVLEEGNRLGDSSNVVDSTKSGGKKNGKHKHQKRPILHKKDMLQVRPQANSHKTSSRKF